MSTRPAAAEVVRNDRPENARKRIGKPFQRGNPGRPKGIRNERAKIGQEAAAALEEKAWNVLERLLGSPSWRARHEATKLVLAYAIGLPRQTLEIAGGFGDLSRELAAALAEARVRRELLTSEKKPYPKSEPAPLLLKEPDAASLQEAPGAAIAADDVEAGHESASATDAHDAAAPGAVAPSSPAPDPEDFLS